MQIRIRTRVVSLVAVLTFHSGCTSATSPDCVQSKFGHATSAPYAGEYMFEECTALNIGRDKPTYGVNEPVKVVFECFPLYSGVGALHAQFLGGGSVSVDVPTVTRDLAPRDYFVARIDLEAHKPFRAVWTIRMSLVREHHLFGSVWIDSVALGDSLVATRSDEAIEAFGFLDTRPARNRPEYVLPPPVSQSNSPLLPTARGSKLEE